MRVENDNYLAGVPFKLVPHRNYRPAGDKTGAGEDAHTTAGLETGATFWSFLIQAVMA
jgi:hypothetical protein